MISSKYTKPCLFNRSRRMLLIRACKLQSALTQYSTSDGCGEGSLPPVTFSDAEVELREDRGPLQEFKGRRDKWQRVVILDHDLV